MTVRSLSEADTGTFVNARPRLFGIARRVLGSTADADDVVQEAWVRWQETDRSKVRDPAAFLATTTTRLALNVGQSARARRETDIGPRLHDAVDPAADPVLGAEQREALAGALRTVLEKLSPTERAVYVLREAFEYPHRMIAEAVGLSEANARQLVTRARRRISDEPRWTVDAAEHERLVEAFVAAAQRGDLARLEQVLTADVALEEGSRVRIAA
jgi:RNA polymerase sigma-70 factor (ECF subfamily)